MEQGGAYCVHFTFPVVSNPERLKASVGVCTFENLDQSQPLVHCPNMAIHNY